MLRPCCSRGSVRGRHHAPRSTAAATLTAVLLCFLSLSAPAAAERIFYLNEQGMHSIASVAAAAAGTCNDQQTHATWKTASSACAIRTNGFAVDEVAGYAVVTCGKSVFKVRYSEPDAEFEEVLLRDGAQEIKGLEGFYGVAIDTKTHVAYVAAYVASSGTGWRVFGHYLPGCATLTKSAKQCEAYRSCIWISATCRDAAASRLRAHLSAPASDPTGGGLFADATNTIWLSFLNEDSAAVPKGAAVVTPGRVNDQLVGFPTNLSGQFPAPPKSGATAEFSYPVIAGGRLFLEGVESASPTTATLFSFDNATTATAVAVRGALPAFRGVAFNAKDGRPQPSFAMLSALDVVYTDASRLMRLTCAAHPCTGGSAVTLACETASPLGAVFYRELPPADAVTPTPPSAAPTPVPAVVNATEVPDDGMGGVNATDAPDATDAPGDTPGGAGNGTAAPGNGTTPLPLPAAAPEKKSKFSGALLGIVMGLCVCIGLLAGFLFTRISRARRKREKEHSKRENARIERELMSDDHDLLHDSDHDDITSRLDNTLRSVAASAAGGVPGFYGAPIGTHRNLSDRTNESWLPSVHVPTAHTTEHETPTQTHGGGGSGASFAGPITPTTPATRNVNKRRRATTHKGHQSPQGHHAGEGHHSPQGHHHGESRLFFDPPPAPMLAKPMKTRDRLRSVTHKENPLRDGVCFFAGLIRGE